MSAHQEIRSEIVEALQSIMTRMAVAKSDTPEEYRLQDAVNDLNKALMNVTYAERYALMDEAHQ